MTTKFTSWILLSVCLLFTTTFASAQTGNLLKNPSADEDKQYWRAFGSATVEETTGKGRSFVVRNGGYFVQDVSVPEDAGGRYAILVAWASSERINRDGAITGLPSLYGYMMNAGDPRGGRIFAYLQGQQMLSSVRVENQWTRLWGIFRIPPGTGRIRMFLNGSAARFDDLGIYIVQTQAEARALPSATTDMIQSPDSVSSH